MLGKIKPLVQKADLSAPSPPTYFKLFSKSSFCAFFSVQGTGPCQIPSRKLHSNSPWSPVISLPYRNHVEFFCFCFCRGATQQLTAYKATRDHCQVNGGVLAVRGRALSSCFVAAMVKLGGKSGCREPPSSTHQGHPFQPIPALHIL